MTGHLLGAAGGLEAGITRAVGAGTRWCAPTINLDDAGRGLRPRLRAQHRRAQMKIDYALSNSFGFGGTNGALLFKRYEE